MLKGFIYGLKFDKDGHKHTGLVRYVGKSIEPERRFAKHMKDSTNHGRVKRSVRKHGRDAFSQVILEMVEAPTMEELDINMIIIERQWIKRLNTAHGAHGLNLTEGGDGVLLFGEAKERHRLAASASLRETLKRPEVQAKLAAGIRERHNRPEVRAMMKDLANKRQADPEFQVRHRAAMRKRFSDPDERQRVSDKMREIMSRPDVKERTRQATIERNKDPTIRAKTIATFKSRYSNNKEFLEGKSKVTSALHKDASFSARYRDGLMRKHADPEYARLHAKHTKDRHKDPAFGMTAKVGIAYHWARKHASEGRFEAAERQIATLREYAKNLLGADKNVKVMEAMKYVEALDAAQMAVKEVA